MNLFNIEIVVTLLTFINILFHNCDSFGGPQERAFILKVAAMSTPESTTWTRNMDLASSYLWKELTRWETYMYSSCIRQYCVQHNN